MKRYLSFILLAAGLLSLSFNGFSQDNNKLSRKEKKEAKKAEEYAFFRYVDTLLMHKSFVLEADYVENQYGQRVNVTPLLNFIRVDSLKAVLQTGSSRYLGYNGVGGVTAEGLLNKWEVSTNNKNLSHDVRFSVNTNIGFYDVMLNITTDNYARATITGLTPGRLIYTGRLRSLYDSRVYKGQNSY